MLSPCEPLAFSTSCTRVRWAAYLPFALVCVFVVWRVLVRIRNATADRRFWRSQAWIGAQRVSGYFGRWIGLEEALSLRLVELERDGEEERSTEHHHQKIEENKPSTLPRLLIPTLSLLQTLTWLSLSTYSFSVSTSSSSALPFLAIALTWLYTFARPLFRPSRTTYYDLFAVYFLHVFVAVIVWYDFAGGGRGAWRVFGAVVNLVVVLVLLGVVGNMPMAIPNEGMGVRVEEIGKSISPEDYTTLFQWLTFSWVLPIVNLGKRTTLQESNVYALSPTLQSRVVFTKFSDTFSPTTTLLKHLLSCNFLDLFLDFAFALVSVVLEYAQPFFLKRILDTIDSATSQPTPAGQAAKRKEAYVYAGLMFLCGCFKAQTDLQHLWFGRRAATRMRSELMAAVYDKSLRRVCLQSSTSTASSTGNSNTDAKKDEASAAQKDKSASAGKDEASGADLGKIVNLMAGDANRVAMMVSGAYFLYMAPFEIVFAGWMLFGLLGWSAFAGFIILVLGWPLNSYVSKKAVRIYRGVSTARDKRMAVLNELIGSVKFIKFFAWEERWIARAMESRGVEMGWLVKSRINSVLFSLIWSTAPVLISVVSFWVYVAMGKELTVGVAFTAIQLFAMIRTPLNVIPTFIVQVLQTHVSLQRIAGYLGEEEVSGQVSLLKMDTTRQGASGGRKGTDGGDGEVLEGETSGDDQDGDEGEYGKLGLKGATLKWNEVKESSSASSPTSGGTEVPKRASSRFNNRFSSFSMLLKRTSAAPPAPVLPSTSPSPSSSNNESGNGSGSNGDESSTTLPASSSGSSSDEGLPQGDENGDHKFELRDVSVAFPEGKLSVVTGPTASGKTALLMSLLGEMTLLSGRLVMRKDPTRVDEHGHVHGISYAAQLPWLRHQSIRENILFNQPLDEPRYESVLECCALRPDLEMLEDGDATEIGARGVSLSGGQKARVALARAVYARTKFVLLDDPLSAVDSHTSRFLYEKLLCGPLLANRTVILVTHHVELVLPGAHYLVRMLDGRIDTQGLVKDLRAQGILDDIAHDASMEAHSEDAPTAAEKVKGEADGEEGEAIEEGAVADAEEGEERAKEGKGKKKPRQLIKDEHREVGGVKWAVYNSYLRASSYWIWAILVFIVVLNQGFGIGEKVWIDIWGSAYKQDSPSIFQFRTQSFPDHEVVLDGLHHHHQAVHHHKSFNLSQYANPQIAALPSALERPLFYVAVYAVLCLVHAFVNILSVIAQYVGALRASKILFRQLLVTVVRATFRFHDTTPTGRMLNRFGKDMETIDQQLASSLQNVNGSLAGFIASVLTIAFVFPVFLIPAFAIGFVYRELAIGYLNTGRDLRRMESNSRSPIFSDFGELLEGIVTVRAFSMERKFMDNLHKKIDLTTKMWYTFWMTNRWLLLNFDTLGAVAVFVTSLLSITYVKNGAGLAGICITSAMAFTTSVYWACRFYTSLELDLNAVERVIEYLDLPQEPPSIIESHRPPAYWPSSSNNEALVAVENLVVKYAPDLPAVLQDVSFQLKSGERVGLLGRTGSGKSTLAMSLLRFVDPSSGRILVDGIDISTIGIHDLRSRITFIPQDATLFSGTLRDNLDPFHEHEDSECLDVLYRVQMIGHSAQASQIPSAEHSSQSSAAGSRPASIHGVDRESSIGSISTATEVDAKTTVSLATQVSAGGTNFSQGQRQLIAMARALLRRSSIIILDEATSSIDFATDAKIQATIREEFTDSLLLTVAHRLRTVIDYDRLIVLDKGKIVEFDAPLALIQKDGGIFRNMCLKSGTYSELEIAARRKAGL